MLFPAQGLFSGSSENLRKSYPSGQLAEGRDVQRLLQADNGQGYFVSPAHGWSCGPTTWLIQQVLGTQPREPGFREVSIRPDLVDLEWARGAEPASRGLIRVEY
jgi:hypothetical protein